MCGDTNADEGSGPKPNLYRDALYDHYTDVGNSLSYKLTPPNGAGHVCTAVCQGAAEAWKSPASDTWVEGIDTLGSSIRTAFSNYWDDVYDAYAQEPETVEVPGEEAWKADWE
ncbi:hypothetical protein [Actinomyces ruminicola]|uniref:Uncharacterized protein n=1 Tax=Actinomyces ruminicola TaxID=332524 RepID=A0A1G9U8Y6_9ACTO|nr:hypothetical protein [Actinomyces ruminicola]SDM56358.1 hypothetical protein SAMN04487766_1043 [Actinomyces ruminicola]